ncbi:Serine/threonine-protein kinase PknB [Aquisphaera giovannonii]|uniref:Serine/threonine-protein kinase PknB n=1 Tax=Aquisphaera giovannonii TaxID=406548 RepID=A0A5B9VY20_9BACT|nr:serine/threonine-protein kinase [Aquisphaera giovannonii]QEH33202.1 Serine/threonine-protein kinase PknB [Aquisphaera giovannonii]
MSESEASPPSFSLSLAARVDRACDLFEAAWREGTRPRIEDYLEAVPEPDRSTFLGQLLASELEARLIGGERPAPADYLDRFPGHSAAISAAFDAVGVPDTLADPTMRADPGPGKSFHRVERAGPLRSTAGVPGYEILGELGRGGMGVVYKARDLRLNRVVALKTLPAADASPEAISRLLAEAEAIARLEHPQIVRVHGVGDHEGHPYFEMEYVDGGSLADRLDGRPRPPRDSAALVKALARAVHEAHRLGVVHRDIKPANVLLSADGTPKLTDFGLAKLLDDSGARAPITRSGALLGTPGYMAPEQAEGRASRVGPGADVHALGALLYELMTGRRPFPGPSLIETLEQVRTAAPAPPRSLVHGLPRDLETICLKCLEKDPLLRYGDARTLAEDLDRFLRGEPIVARPAGALERVARVVARGRGDREFVAWGPLMLLMACPLVFLAHFTVFVLARLGSPLLHASLNLPVVVVFFLLAFGAAIHGRRLPAAPGPLAQLVMSTLIGQVAGTVVLCDVHRRLTEAPQPNGYLAFYPICTASMGMMFFALGAPLWGRLYLAGLVCFAAAPMMTIDLTWAPLAFSLVIPTILLAVGLHLRRLGREDVAASEIRDGEPRRDGQASPGRR